MHAADYMGACRYKKDEASKIIDDATAKADEDNMLSPAALTELLEADTNFPTAQISQELIDDMVTRPS